jgi:hypothetical protein
MANKFTRMIHTSFGRTLISIVLGIGIASIFRKTCKDASCFKFTSPPAAEVKESVYLHGGSCYKFDTETVKCGSGEQVSFS